MQSPPKSDESTDLDPDNPVLYIEHCRSWRVFRRRAEELHAALQTSIQNSGEQFKLQLQLNAQGAPRRGAFELSFALQPTTVASELRPIWSGLKRTPRAQKFPNVDEMCEQIIQANNELSSKNNKRKRTSETSPSSSSNVKRSKAEK